jgi:hypothetical protein
MTPVERLVAYAEQLGLESADLDLLVHDAAQEAGLGALNALEGDDAQEGLAAVEAEAAAVNNGGLEAQVAFLLGHDSEENVRELLGRAAGGRSAG